MGVPPAETGRPCARRGGHFLGRAAPETGLLRVHRGGPLPHLYTPPGKRTGGLAGGFPVGSPAGWLGSRTGGNARGWRLFLAWPRWTPLSSAESDFVTGQTLAVDGGNVNT